VTAYTKSVSMRMIALLTLLFVSAKRNRGHIGSDTSSQGPGCVETASNNQEATGSRGREVVAGSLGVEGSQETRRKCEPGVLLAEVISRRAAERRHSNTRPAGEGCEYSNCRFSEGRRFPPGIGNHGDDSIQLSDPLQ